MSVAKNPGQIILLFLILFPLALTAQVVEKVYLPNIHTAQLYQRGNQASLPIMMLNSRDRKSVV